MTSNVILKKTVQEPTGGRIVAKEIKVWGEGIKGLWSFGKTVDIPKGYVEVPTGDPFITRKIKALAKTVYVRMNKRKRSGYSRAIGILATKKVVEKALNEAEATENIRAEKRVLSAVYREKREIKARGRTTQKVLESYPNMPEDEARQIVGHAFEVGSGRVGRSSLFELDAKIDLAVKAHVRHVHTEYEELLMQGWDREEARQEVAEEIIQVIRQWRGEEPTT